MILKPRASSKKHYFQSQQLYSIKDVAEIQVQVDFFFLCFNMISKVEECRGGCGSESLGMSQGDGLHIL